MPADELATRVSRRRSRTRQQDLLGVSLDLFYERGFDAVTVDEIGERAGVTGPAIYRHFSGKDEILGTLFDDALDRLVEATAGEFVDPLEELDRLVSGHAAFVLAERKLAGVKLREDRSLAEPYRRRLHRREQRYIERWVACVSRCYPKVTRIDATAAVLASLGALNSVAFWPPAITGAPDVDRTLTRLVLGGLHGLAPEARSVVRRGAPRRPAPAQRPT